MGLKSEYFRWNKHNAARTLFKLLAMAKQLNKISKLLSGSELVYAFSISMKQIWLRRQLPWYIKLYTFDSNYHLLNSSLRINFFENWNYNIRRGLKLKLAISEINISSLENKLKLKELKDSLLQNKEVLSVNTVSDKIRY